MYFRQHFCLTTLIFPERQSSTATTGSTGTQRSCVTVNTTLSTIPEDINQIQTERKPEHKNIYRDKERKFRLRVNLKVLEEKIMEIGLFDHENLSFDKSTAFIKGSKSDYILKVDENLIKKCFPKYSLHEVHNAGHWVHYDKPEMFEKIVTSLI